MIYAVGDIHGHLDKLKASHDRIAEDRAAKGSTPGPIIHIGDLCDRGPDTKGVIQYLIDGIERGLPFLRPLGVNPAKVSLALSLALRFIPVLAQITQEVREAQRVRGLENSVIALAIPLFVRPLRMSDDIADAIEARGY